MLFWTEKFVILTLFSFPNLCFTLQGFWAAGKKGCSARFETVFQIVFRPCAAHPVRLLTGDAGGAVRGRRFLAARALGRACLGDRPGVRPRVWRGGQHGLALL